MTNERKETECFRCGTRWTTTVTSDHGSYSHVTFCPTCGAWRMIASADRIVGEVLP